MPAPRRTGVNAVTRTLADGSTRTYYYDRRTRAPLGTDREAAIAAALAAEAETERQPEHRPGTFGRLVADYLASSRFSRLAPKTQDLNRFYAGRLSEMFGDLPVRAITRPVVVRLRETHSSRPWYATHLLATLRLLLQSAVDAGMLEVNPAMRPGGVKPQARHTIWSVDETRALINGLRGQLRVAAALMLYTAQRPSDVLAMTRASLRTQGGKTWVLVRQAKTGELIAVPAHTDLVAVLEAEPARSTLLVPAPRGGLWSYRNFSRSWDREIRKLGMPEGKQRRDMRRTAMVRMAEAGASIPQIAAVSGHTIEQTARIIDTYVPRRSEVAAAGIEAWERAPTRENVIVSLPTPAARRRKQP